MKYEHDLTLGDRVVVQVNWGDELEGVVHRLWDNCYVSILTDDGEIYAGPEYNAELVEG